jgi:RNase P subunit RPR2
MQKQLAREEIEKLLQLAKKTKDEKLSQRYVELAFKIAQRNQVKIGNRRFCKKCLRIFNAQNTKIRKTKKSIIYTCKCGSTKKFMLDQNTNFKTKSAKL